jgi:hypothetical protein
LTASKVIHSFTQITAFRFDMPEVRPDKGID